MLTHLAQQRQTGNNFTKDLIKPKKEKQRGYHDCQSYGSLLAVM